MNIFAPGIEYIYWKYHLQCAYYMFDLDGNSKRNRTKQFPPLPLFSQQLFSYSTMRSRSVWF